jgi:undecaprenyl-diphosphatase
MLVGWLAAFAGAGLLDSMLKLAIRRPRPAGAQAFLHISILGYSHSYSFPSGHALGSLVGYGMLAYLLVSHYESRRARTAIVVLASVCVLAIGVSRLYLGVHYFSDVVGGYAAGVVWLAVVISGVEIARRHT